MSALAQSMLRIVTFGAANAGWGAAWDGAERQLVLAGDRLNVAGEFELEGAAAEDDWRLSGDGISLAIVPAGEAATNPELGGFDQLCRVHGETTIDGVRQALDECGRRCTRAMSSLEQFGSIRDFSAWFETGDGAALTALRPVNSRGHDADLIGAALFANGGARVVAEPRLSTTYTAEGLPSRVGLELWIAEQENEEELYPRRVAGEAAAAGMSAASEAIELQARPFRCVSQGQQGSGIYLLVYSR